MLIVIYTIEFAKAVINGSDELKKAFDKSIKKLISAIVIFFIPTIVNVIFSMIGNTGIIACFNNATIEKIQEIYITNANKLVENAKLSLELSDYEDAIKNINKIKDSTEKNKLQNSLNEIRDLVYLKENVNNLQFDYSDERYEELYKKIQQLNNYELKNDLTKILAAAKEKYQSNNNYYFDKKTYQTDYNGQNVVAGGHKINGCTPNQPNIGPFDTSELSCPLYIGNYSNTRKKIYFNAQMGHELIDTLKKVCTYVNSNLYINSLQDDGFYVSRNDAGDDYHAKGLAFDLNDNWSYNGYFPYRGSGINTWNNYKRFICEECNGNENCDKNVNFQIFHKYFEGKGWCWGGNWSPSSFDPMHFEYRGGCSDLCLTSNKAKITC